MANKSLAARMTAWQWEADRRQSEAEDYKRRKAGRRQARQARAAKRRQAGKVVHVRGYCRRGASRFLSGDEGMPF